MTARGEQPMMLTWLGMLSDMQRLRILRLLDREELSVGELAKALQLPQSTVSRHLKLLHDAGWCTKRTEGTTSLYRLSDANLEEGARQLWGVTRVQVSGGGSSNGASTFAEDDARLASVLADRRIDSKAFFGKVAGTWDDLRRSLFGDSFTSEALLSLLHPSWVVADLGCGTGNAAEHLAPFVKQVIAVDREAAMLEGARKSLAARGIMNVDFRLGDLTRLPIKDAELDAAITVLVMHHVVEPAVALREIARTLKKGGTAMIVDMVAHSRDSYRHTMGHVHLGFEEKSISAWAKAAGLGEVRYRRLRAAGDGKGPGLFVATMRKV